MKNIDLRRVALTTNKSYGEYIRLSVNGQIAVSKGAVEYTGMTEDDKAVFFQNNNDPKQWFFSYGKEGDYKVRFAKPDTDDKTLQFSCAALRDEIIKALGLSKKTTRLWLSKEPVVLEGRKLWILNYRD